MGKPYRFHKIGDDILLCIHQLIHELRKHLTCFLLHHSGAYLDVKLLSLENTMRQIALNTIKNALPSRMNLSHRSIHHVWYEHISAFFINNFLDYPLESSVIHLINTNQEACLKGH
jgi:hypothetical protein